MRICGGAASYPRAIVEIYLPGERSVKSRTQHIVGLVTVEENKTKFKTPAYPSIASLKLLSKIVQTNTCMLPGYQLRLPCCSDAEIL